jgi:nucleoside-diphosphate-sugar epimerase
VKIFVTGGTGFLGRRVVRQLLEEGHSVRCLARPGSDVATLRDGLAPGAESRLQIVRGQLNRVPQQQLEGCDALCHIAAAMKGCTAALFADNVIATRRLLTVADTVGVARVVLISSLAIYGTSELRPRSLVDESCPLEERPHLRDSYTYSKLAAEKAAWELHEAGKCPLVVIRPGVIYGPGRDPLSARVGLSVGRVLLRMGSRHLLPYVHVDACAAGVALAVTMPAIEGQAFNLLDADLMTAGQFLKQYRRSRAGLRVIPVPHWAIVPLSRLNVWYTRWSRGQIPAVLTPYKSEAFWKRLRYSTAKAQSVLGWKPHPSTHVGLTALLESGCPV